MSRVVNRIPRFVTCISRIVGHSPNISYNKYITQTTADRNADKIYNWSKLPEVNYLLPTYNEAVTCNGTIVMRTPS